MTRMDRCRGRDRDRRVERRGLARDRRYRSIAAAWPLAICSSRCAFPTHDGHDFVACALARGAAGAVVDREPPGFPATARLLRVTDALAV